MQGISGSCKSTVAANVAYNNPDMMLSSDKFRRMIAGNDYNQNCSAKAFMILMQVLEERMRQGLQTIVDATSLKAKDIKKYTDVAKRYGVPYRVVSMRVDVDVAYERVIKRASDGGLYVPKEVIQKQFDRLVDADTFCKTHGKSYQVFEDVMEATKYIESCFRKQMQDDYIVLNEPNVWFIGDVHGCADELTQLITYLRMAHPDSVIYQLGDIIDRGPYNVECFEILKGVQDMHIIMGNHEMNFIEEVCADKECRSSARRVTHEQFHYAGQRQEFVDYLKHHGSYMKLFKCKGYDYSVLATHSGVNTKLIAQQKQISRSDMCMRTGAMYHDERVGKLIQVHGHCSWSYTHIADQVLDKPHAYNIDSHCYAGGRLTAFNPFTKEFIQVDAERVYYKDK